MEKVVAKYAICLHKKSFYIKSEASEIKTKNIGKAVHIVADLLDKYLILC